ncbi:MAG: DNA repair protein RecO [Lysobacterales bacterium CG02_land_8_20_14_3_00_62_12]|nr:MAG: DNA repair protein RecO [Xanthomonadales bacterium CG02_land_8_20_14_3_00_62_12]
MRVLAESAFLLHARPYRETSALVELFTRDYGRIAAVARGVRASKPRLQRGALSPFQFLSIDFLQQGDLALLLAVEVVGHPLYFTGTKLQSALYVNELLTRLTERNDPHAAVFQRYAALLAELPECAHLGWTLRRFERDLLALLGYGLQLGQETASGLPLDPLADYAYEPGHGPRLWSEQSSALRCRGSELLALQADQQPDAQVLGKLRQLMRTVIRHHLGGRELDAWRVFR